MPPLQAGQSWLISGISKRDGLWGLGCSVCVAYLASGRKCSGGKIRQFATFQVRPRWRAEARMLIERHHGSKSHRVASGASRTRHESRHEKAARAKPQPLASPSSSDSEESSEESAEDAALLKGDVPSPGEWQEAWAAVFSRGMLSRCSFLQVSQCTPRLESLARATQHPCPDMLGHIS